MSDTKIQNRVLCRILSTEQMELVSGAGVEFCGDSIDTNPKSDGVGEEEETEEN